MTIRRGEPWGVEVPRPPDLTLAGSDRALAASAVDGPVGLTGGDLFRSLGAPEPRDPVQLVDIDGLVVVLDHERRFEAVAHVLVRRSWCWGRVIACMNVDHVGDWNVAPRAHPNDGRFDLVECAPSMSRRDRWAAWRRLPQGTHIPHPDISVERATEREWSFDRPHRVVVDGRAVGRARHVSVHLVPDRYRVAF
jgi:hypothetical protein